MTDVFVLFGYLACSSASDGKRIQTYLHKFTFRACKRRFSRQNPILPHHKHVTEGNLFLDGFSVSSANLSILF